MTSRAFLELLKRFVSRRGIPNKIYSDNAKTFKGANNSLKKALNEISSSPSLANYFSSNSIEWNFNAPYSPHLGGLFEAAIKSFKKHFRILTKSKTLTFREAETLTIQIEAVLNSRPLTPLTSNPNDLEALTPGHFIIGRPITALPPYLNEISKNDNHMTLSETYNELATMIQAFWSRWQTEYLQQFHISSKWHEDKCKLKEGSLVIVKQEKIPPTCWKLARILKLHMGKDGRPRIATLKTSQGTTTRAVKELSLLPVLCDNL